MSAITDQLLAAIRQSDLSDRALSVAAAGNADTIRYIKTGRSSDPKASTIEALCGALGLELYIGPPRPAPECDSQPPESDSAGAAVLPLHPIDARPPPGSGLAEPVCDRRLATLLTRLADGWEDATPEEDRDRAEVFLNAALEANGFRGGRRYAALSAGSDGA